MLLPWSREASTVGKFPNPDPLCSVTFKHIMYCTGSFADQVDRIQNVKWSVWVLSTHKNVVTYLPHMLESTYEEGDNWTQQKIMRFFYIYNETKFWNKRTFTSSDGPREWEEDGCHRCIAFLDLNSSLKTVWLYYIALTLIENWLIFLHYHLNIDLLTAALSSLSHSSSSKRW